VNIALNYKLIPLSSSHLCVAAAASVLFQFHFVRNVKLFYSRFKLNFFYHSAHHRPMKKAPQELRNLIYFAAKVTFVTVKGRSMSSSHSCKIPAAFIIFVVAVSEFLMLSKLEISFTFSLFCKYYLNSTRRIATFNSFSSKFAMFTHRPSEDEWKKIFAIFLRHFPPER
jgi:hypothetical protein